MYNRLLKEAEGDLKLNRRSEVWDEAVVTNE